MPLVLETHRLGVAPASLCHLELICPPASMGLVRCDVAPVGGVHAVSTLAYLEARTNEGRHSADERHARVRGRTGSRCPMSLTDESSEPSHEPACTWWRSRFVCIITHYYRQIAYLFLFCCITRYQRININDCNKVDATRARYRSEGKHQKFRQEFHLAIAAGICSRTCSMRSKTISGAHISSKLNVSDTCWCIAATCSFTLARRGRPSAL